MEYTPAMQQYIDLKKQNKDCILFFRLGDFYEVFFEDAKICSELLDLILTSKNKNSPNPIPMAGIPHHSSEKYIKKLISNGYKVAIAEQTTQAIPGKIVEREIISVITPGTYIEENNNYNNILSICNLSNKNGNNYHIAWGDFSIGEYYTKSLPNIESMQKFIFNIKPSEIILDIELNLKNEISNILKQYLNCLISIYDIPSSPNKFILNHFKIQSLNSFGKALENGRLQAFTLLLHYIKNTQKTNINNINKISFHNSKNFVMLDDITIKNLEIFQSSYEANEKHSLYGILNTNNTKLGSRLLYHYLTNPINNISEIKKRLNYIEYFKQYAEHTEKICKILKKITDIPRLISKILYKKTLAINFQKLKFNLGIFFEQQNNFLLDEIKKFDINTQTINNIQKIYLFLDKLITDSENISNEINFTKEGFNDQIDDLKKIAFHSDKLLVDYQQELIKLSGINNIKIKFVKNQGYYIEITNKDIKKFEEIIDNKNEKIDFLRKNTLKGAQRYITSYLNKLEQKILSAKEKLIELEFQALKEAKELIENLNHSLNDFSNAVAKLDLFTSQAILANNKNYTKPQFQDSEEINIIDGRHPVIEEFLPLYEEFIPNNLEFGKTNNLIHIITGPNMGGKSTYLRQNAIIVLMAHCGLFVPAKTTKLGIVSGIFARVGSGDIIAKNQSTFMTEMIEVSNILNNADSKSLVIFDELGRGTSTYDGLALTKAILSYIHEKIKSKTLIATHYHELINMEKQYDGIKNFSVSVYETQKDVVFMKKIVEGGANKSYGIDVAKLAGINSQIISQAESNLNHLENSPVLKGNKENISSNQNIAPKTQNLLSTPDIIEDPKYQKIKSILESFDVNNITPIQAIQLLAKLKSEMGKYNK